MAPRKGPGGNSLNMGNTRTYEHRTPAYNQGGNTGSSSTTKGTGNAGYEGYVSPALKPKQSNWIPTGNAQVDALGKARTAYTNDYVNDYGTPGSFMEKYNRQANASGYGLDLGGPPPYNPTSNGGGGGGGWGGGGTAPAGIDQKTFDWLMGQYGQRKPNQYTSEMYQQPEAYQPQMYGDPKLWEYQNLELDPLDPFNTEGFDRARQGIDERIAGASAAGNTAFDRGLAEIDAYENPYLQGPRQQTPGTSPALQRSMKAWGGAGAGAAADEARFGFEMDQGMGSVYDLLGRAEDSYTQGLRRGNAGDRMQFDQRLGNQGRTMNLDVDLRQQAGEAAWRERNQARNDQMAFANNAGQNQAGQFNTGVQNQWGMANTDLTNQAGMYNSQAMRDWMDKNTDLKNQTGQANTQLGNQWNADIMALLQQLGMGGMNGAGKQTLDLGDYPNLIA